MDQGQILVYAALVGQLIAGFIRRLPETSAWKNKYIPRWIFVLSWAGFVVDALKKMTDTAIAPAAYQSAAVVAAHQVFDVGMFPIAAAFLVVVLSRAFHKIGWSGLFG